MIEVKNISKKFIKQTGIRKKTEFYANNNISFDATDGKVVGILGPNGAGKTTLLRIIAGIMIPTSGTIKIDNLEYDKAETKIKEKIAFLSGNTKLYKDMSPYELLFMCGEYYKVDKAKLLVRIKEISNKFDMDSFLYQKIENLSTGQMQRTNIARCLIHNPKYYIFDEATSGLDIIASKIILDFIKEEKSKGKCILYSTHYMEEAENLCDEFILIHKGNVIGYGTSEQIKKNTESKNLREAFLKLTGGEKNEE